MTNETLNQIWEEARDQGDEKTLALIEEIDNLKKAYGSLFRRFKRNKLIWRDRTTKTSMKSFLRGQSYIREKISRVLSQAGFLEAGKAALATHIDYLPAPVGKYPGDPTHV